MATPVPTCQHICRKNGPGETLNFYCKNDVQQGAFCYGHWLGFCACDCPHSKDMFLVNQFVRDNATNAEKEKIRKIKREAEEKIRDKRAREHKFDESYARLEHLKARVEELESRMLAVTKQ
jgi:hypothetical protein